MMATVRIQFETSGGYGGLFATQPLRVEVDTDDATRLDAAEAAALVRLAEESGLLTGPVQPPGRRGVGPAPGMARDVFTYRLVISGEEGERAFAFDDTTLPPQARPLVQHLRELAVRRRLDGP
jgi:hypothetical protein